MAAGVAVGAVLAWVASRLMDDFAGTAAVLAEANPRWLIAAFVAEACCYACIGGQLSRLLGRGAELGRLVPFRLGLVIYGFGSLLPVSPAPGFAMAMAELRRRGYAARRLALALFGCSWFNIRSFLSLAALTGTTAVLRGRTPSGTRGIVLGSVLFVVAGLVLSGIVVMRPKTAERAAAVAGRLNWRGGRPARSSARLLGLHWHASLMEMLGSRRNQLAVSALALGSWVADAICLRFALISVGVHAGMGIVLIAYIAAMIAATIPLLPGGIGLVEATVPSILHRYGVPLDAALAGTLVWRMIALLLPGLAGFAALLSLRAAHIEAPAGAATEAGG